MSATRARFHPGQVIRHLRFGYRGVVVDVDPGFQGTEEWYRQVARSRPPKDRPWYHVLVHDSGHRTYVAERHLDVDDSGEPVNHPQMAEFFSEYRDGQYQRHGAVN
jgi:heat shock protein HspQ